MKLERDVVIVGGGIAGVHAAIACGRAGLKTTLIEHGSTIGGLSTMGLVNPFMRHWLGSEKLIDGIFGELLDRLKEENGLLINSFDSEIMKACMLSMLKEANVEVVFNTIPIEVKTIESILKSVRFFTSLGTSFEMEARYFVDSTGDGSLGFLAGAEYFSGDSNGINQAMTVMFTMSGVDFSKVIEDIRNNPSNFFSWVSPKQTIISVAGYFDEIEQAKKDGLEKLQDYFFFIQLPGESRVTVNTTHVYDLSTTNPFDVSLAMVDCTEQAMVLKKFANRYIKGFEKARIEKIADVVGVRESRRIKGLYEFSGVDVMSHRKFEDGVVKACYGIDIHNSPDVDDNEKTFIPAYKDYYEIPLRSLISANFENLGIAGRCFSSDFAGHSAARIMPTCAGMGQAIGAAISLAYKKSLPLKDVNAKNVKTVLKTISNRSFPNYP